MSAKTVLALTASLLAVLTRGVASAVDDELKLPTSTSWIQNAPLTVSVSTVGQFSNGRSWYLSVNSAGQAELTIGTYPLRTRRRFQVSEKQLAALRQLLAEARFFELADEYGEQVVDGSTKTVTVTAGSRTKTIAIYSLVNWIHSDRARLREPSRVVRILVMIRGWFRDTEAVDLRPYDQRVLDAVR